MLYLWLEDVNCQCHRQLCHASCLPRQRNYTFVQHFNHQKIWIAILEFLGSHFQVDEAAVEITMSIPTNLGSFSKVPVFHGITFTKSPRPPYSTLVGHLPRPLPTIVHGMKSGATRVPWTEGNTGQGYPGQRGTEGRYPVAGERWDRGIRGKSTKLGNFWATVSSVA